MMRRCFLLAGVLALSLSSHSRALDRIKLLRGTPSVANGSLTEMSPTVVKIEQGQIPKSYAVNLIDYIEFDEDPRDLKNTRTAMKAGELTKALALINKVDPAEVKRTEIKQDVEFYKAILMARLAMAGNGSLKEAGKLLFAFEKANPGNYHYFAACEVLGDLLVADRKYESAESFYAKLASAPWPDYRIKATVLTGRTLEAQKQYAKAIAKYDEAESMEGEGKDVESQKLTALLGKATSLAGSGKSDEAVKLVMDVITKSDSDNVDLQARAYIALGNCFKTAGKTKAAIMAFVQVDQLYSGAAEQHAEALANLGDLWKKDDKAQRAEAAIDELKSSYPNSRWAKKMAADKGG
jgi:tetratricopeptide (TPR) repeat protein